MTIPVVFVVLGNPINSGLVKNFARPEGNTTGLASVATDLGPKRLEMLLSAEGWSDPFLFAPLEIAGSPPVVGRNPTPRATRR